MGSKYRIGAVFKQRVHEAVVKKARRNGISDSAQVAMLVVRQLVAEGDLTDAELEADRDDDTDTKEDA